MIAIPYWLSQSLAALPLALWVYLGIGIPWALIALPRKDWHNRVMVACVSFVFGPGLLTAWMFILGTLGSVQKTAYLRYDLALTGSIVIALLGIFFARRKAHRTTSESTHQEHVPLAYDERIIIMLITAAVVLRWFVVAYWPFTAYDSLWVYGYQSRLWFLQGVISADIGYYPQFMQLQYTFMQLAVGTIDDHAARIIVPFLQVGSILATYLLGQQLFNRRVGLFAAAIWALYPHLGMWSHVGDLEVPTTFLFTTTSVFFLRAWTHEDRTLRQRYAIISGLVFGVAMWTKPTAGAFIWSVISLTLADFIRVRGAWRLWLPRLEVTISTGLACIPLGSIWYLRNIAFGHPALVFPDEIWLTLATRSSDLLTWPLLALFIILVYIISTRRVDNLQWFPLSGTFLIILGVAPSNAFLIRAFHQSIPIFFNIERINPPESYIQPLEALAIVLGVLMVISPLWRFRTEKAKHNISIIVWVYLLALPYFVTWFWSYSYHFRLSFVIVPLLILPIAVLLAQWFSKSRSVSWKKGQRTLWIITLIACGLPGIFIPLFKIDTTYDWLWTNRYEDDYAKYILHNPGVYLTAEQLWGYEQNRGISPVVIAPGEQRLPFFLPEATIISDTLPTRFEELKGATHFLYGTQARWKYEGAEIAPLENQIVAGLGRADLMETALNFTKGIFRYELYQLGLEQRFADLEQIPVMHIIEEDVIFGDFVRYLGDNVSNTQLAGNRIYLDYLWEVLAPVEREYIVHISLHNIEDDTIYATWEAPIAPHHDDTIYYSSRVWEVGERILDSRFIELSNPGDLPQGSGLYRIVINLVDVETGEAVPVTINGQTSTDGYMMVARFSIGG